MLTSALVAGTMGVPATAGADTPLGWSNIVVVDDGGAPLTLGVGTIRIALEPGAASSPLRLPAGEHDVTVAGNKTAVALAGGCDVVWVVTPASADQKIVELAECPAPRVEDSGDASIRLINAGSTAATLKLSAGGVVTVPTDQWSASARIEVHAGAQRLSVSRTDLPGPITMMTATLAPDHGYAAVLAGGGEEPVAFFLIEDAGAQPPKPPPLNVPINTGLAASGPRMGDVGVAGTAAGLVAVVGAALYRFRRRRAAFVVPIVALALTLSACTLVDGRGARRGGQPTSSARRTLSPLASPPEASEPSPDLERSSPHWLAVDQISAPVVPVSADQMADLPTVLPAGDAGWVTGTSIPGEAGVSFIVGHVAFSDSSAVFDSLDLVASGDGVEVTMVDGQRVVFTVEQSFTVPKGSLPAWLESPSTVPLLVLVSCTGPVSPATGLHTLNRVVVAAANVT